MPSCCGEFLLLVGVDLGEPEAAAVFRGEPIEDRHQLFAGSAPGRPEIDQHGRVCRCLDDIRHETADCYGSWSRIVGGHQSSHLCVIAECYASDSGRAPAGVQPASEKSLSPTANNFFSRDSPKLRPTRPVFKFKRRPDALCAWSDMPSVVVAMKRGAAEIVRILSALVLIWPLLSQAQVSTAAPAPARACRRQIIQRSRRGRRRCVSRQFRQ